MEIMAAPSECHAFLQFFSEKELTTSIVILQFFHVVDLSPVTLAKYGYGGFDVSLKSLQR